MQMTYRPLRGGKEGSREGGRDGVFTIFGNLYFLNMRKREMKEIQQNVNIYLILVAGS